MPGPGLLLTPTVSLPYARTSGQRGSIGYPSGRLIDYTGTAAVLVRILDQMGVGFGEAQTLKIAVRSCGCSIAAARRTSSDPRALSVWTLG